MAFSITIKIDLLL